MRIKFLIAAIVMTLPFTAQARDMCDNPALSQAFAVSESEYKAGYYFGGQNDTDPRQTPHSADSSQWLQRISQYDPAPLPVTGEAGGHHPHQCNYDTATEVLDELEAQLGFSSPYLKQWVNNQNIVLASCEQGVRLPLLSPVEGADLPPRAWSDFEYQKAAQLFYTRTDADAQLLETEFSKLARDTHAPMQARAATMVLRTALLFGGLDHLMDVVARMKADPATAPVYPYAEDTVFTVYWGEPLVDSDNVAAQLKRLQWLTDLALERQVPVFSTATHIQQNYRRWRQQDARYQLGGLIHPGRLNAQDIIPGWWLSDIPQDHATREAVRQLAQREPYIDFLATHFVVTPLKSWRWALYDQKNQVWQRSIMLAHHAIDRFCSGGGVEWLYEGARLLPPGDTEVDWVRSQLIRALDDAPLHQRQPALRGHIYQQSVRLALLQGDDAAARQLIARNDIDYVGVNGPRAHRVPSYANGYHQDNFFSEMRAYTLDEALSWYAHQGRWNELKQMLDASGEAGGVYLHWSRDVRDKYRTLLASDTQDMMNTIGDTYNFSPLLGLLSTRAQLTILARPISMRYPSAAQNLREQLASSQLMRAWLLGDTELIKTAVPLYAEVFPRTKLEVFKAFSGDRFDQALFFLRHQSNPVDAPHIYEMIDDKNRETLYNWNGPWCHFVPDDMKQVSAAVWEFAPANTPLAWYRHHYNNFDGYGLQYDPDKFAAARESAFLAHPIWRDAATAELQQLAKVEPGADYLTHIVLTYARWPRWWNRLMGRGDEIPEALHLAVRTARYGCHRDGANYGVASRAAWRILQKDFAGTFWADNTPYWYK